MSRNEMPEGGDWKAVERAVHRQMRKLDMSIARLSRESGISETTIRYIGRPEKRQRSTMVALSAALGFPYDYLVDVLRGAADPEDPPESTTETKLIRNLLRADVDSLKVKLDRLGASLHVIDDKVDVILGRRPKE